MSAIRLITTKLLYILLIYTVYLTIIGQGTIRAETLQTSNLSASKLYRKLLNYVNNKEEEIAICRQNRQNARTQADINKYDAESATYERERHLAGVALVKLHFVISHILSNSNMKFLYLPPLWVKKMLLMEDITKDEKGNVLAQMVPIPSEHFVFIDHKGSVQAYDMTSSEILSNHAQYGDIIGLNNKYTPNIRKSSNTSSDTGMVLAVKLKKTTVETVNQYGKKKIGVFDSYSVEYSHVNIPGV